MAIILVADDDGSIRKLLTVVLRSAGHDVLCAGDGLEAVGLFQSSPDPIDLVITDLVMPVMNGHEAIRRMRETRPDARIICMTGYSDQQIPEQVTLVSKPFVPGDMLACAERVLSLR
jgi:CheY-like chemotaxis protein